METIRTTTLVEAPMERCFKLAISIDLQIAAGGYEAIAGVTSGLIGPGDTVTWEGSEFGWKFNHQSLIEVWRPYSYFRDIMIDGPFKAYEHNHHFATMNDGTRIRDEIRFTSPMGGALGRASEKFLLRKRVARMLRQRNILIKRAAESDRWHEFLDGQSEVDMRVFQAPTPNVKYAANVYAD
jgi:ligand-binding SRPBCC domain-containing protein